MSWMMVDEMDIMMGVEGDMPFNLGHYRTYDCIKADFHLAIAKGVNG